MERDREPIEFFVVDFDRTLVDSDKLFEVFVEIADKYYKISREQLEKAHDDFERRGDSFDTASYVRNHLIDEDRLEDWEELEKRFIHEGRELNMMMPGAAELLEWMAANAKRYGILTYGNPLWQRLKLSAAGFNHVRHIIIEHKQKGKFISAWQQPDGTFRLPEEFGRGDADAIVLIDDKAVSFDDFPSSPSRGYWVVDHAKSLPSQQGIVPENVTHYSTLYEIVMSLS